MDIETLRPAVEAMAQDISGLLWDRQVCDRFAGIVRSSEDLLKAEQGGNPFLLGVRRWWATSSALILRRQVDGGTENSLRSVLLVLVEVGAPEERAQFEGDLAEVVSISDRFRSYLNSLIHGAPAAAGLTFDNLSNAIDTLEEIAQRVYAAVANVPRRLSPVPQFAWTDIFEYAWIANPETEMAYQLGKEGVPYDALPMTRQDSDAQSRLNVELKLGDNGDCLITVTNIGAPPALDVRAFLPHARTVIDVGKLPPGESCSASVRASIAEKINGRAVLEFEDVNGRVYRQYADVSLPIARVRRLDRTPYRVSGRIVAPGRVGTV